MLTLPMKSSPSFQGRFDLSIERGSDERIRPAIVHPREEHAMRPHGAIKNEKAQLGTCEGVAEAGHRLDGALTVAHAVWHFAGAT